jgi:hypothetical protein
LSFTDIVTGLAEHGREAFKLKAGASRPSSPLRFFGLTLTLLLERLSEQAESDRVKNLKVGKVGLPPLHL